MMPHKAVILSWIIYKYSNLVTNTRSVSEESSFDKNLEKLNKVNWTAAPLLPFPTFFHPRLSWTTCDVGSSYFSFNLHILKLKRKIFPNQLYSSLFHVVVLNASNASFGWRNFISMPLIDCFIAEINVISAPNMVACYSVWCFCVCMDMVQGKFIVGKD